MTADWLARGLAALALYWADAPGRTFWLVVMAVAFVLVVLEGWSDR